VSLAIFDLDSTLIAGDSDHSWGEYLIEQNIVDADSFRKANDRFFDDYKAGILDMEAYVSFALAPLREMSRETRDKLHREFMDQKIAPLMLPKAQSLIQKHKDQGDVLLIITATNRFITEPIAQLLGIDNLIATDPELVDDRFTGRIIGIPSFQDGKVTRLEQWVEQHQEEMAGSFFYSDSFNDIPLLERVSFPCAVDPDEKLRAHATNKQWPSISLR
jgi:HAD superfamily hydrolase (TIGR01490 family)